MICNKKAINKFLNKKRHKQKIRLYEPQKDSLPLYKKKVWRAGMLVLY